MWYLFPVSSNTRKEKRGSDRRIYKKEKKNGKAQFMTCSRPAEIIKTRAVHIKKGGGHQAICAARRMLKREARKIIRRSAWRSSDQQILDESVKLPSHLDGAAMPRSRRFASNTKAYALFCLCRLRARGPPLSFSPLLCQAWVSCAPDLCQLGCSASDTASLCDADASSRVL